MYLQTDLRICNWSSHPQYKLFMMIYWKKNKENKIPWQPSWIPRCRFKIQIWNCPHWICGPHKCMFRPQNAVYMRFISWYIYKYWFCASLSDILQHQRVPSQNPNLNIFPEFSKLRTFIMWQVKCPPFWKYQVCFNNTFFLSLPKITLTSLDYINSGKN